MPSFGNSVGCRSSLYAAPVAGTLAGEVEPGTRRDVFRRDGGRLIREGMDGEERRQPLGKNVDGGRRKESVSVFCCTVLPL
jgi:hypothetical protein